MKKANYKRILARFYNAETQIISFDVFDTAVVRPFFKPGELFRFIDLYLMNNGISLPIKFSLNRIEAERDIRFNFKEDGFEKDPTLDGIYEKMAEITSLDPAVLEQLKKLEIDMEILLCEGNPTVQRIYKDALQSGKRVIFTSDSYLSADVIATLLRKSGYAEYEKLYVSCEWGATKKHGGLYPLVASDLGVSADAIFHLGDNLHADIRKAEEAGLKAILIPKAVELALHKESAYVNLWERPHSLPLPLRSFIAMGIHRANTDAEERTIPHNLYGENLEQFGYAGLGPALYAITAWICQRCVCLGIDHIFFLSRDGHLPYMAWKTMRLTEQYGITAEYLHISRKSIQPALFYTRDIIETAFSYKIDEYYTVDDFLQNRFDDDVIKVIVSMLERYGIDLKMRMMLVSDSIQSLFRENETLIKKIIRPCAEKTVAYYAEQFSGHENAAIFDVGKKGSFQVFLKDVLNINVHGLYVIGDTTINEHISHRDFSSFFPVTSIFKPYSVNAIIFESLLSSTMPSLRGVGVDNRMHYENDTLGPKQKDAIGTIHQGALKFIEDADIKFSPCYARYVFNPYEITTPLRKIWNYPADAGLLANVRHEDPLSSGKSRPMATYYSEKKTRPSSNPDLFPDLTKAVPGKNIVIYCPAMTRIPGGAERIAAFLSWRLREKGYFVAILTNGKKPGAPVYPLPERTPLLVSDCSIPNVRKLMRKLAPDAFLVLASGSVVARLEKAVRWLMIPTLLSERAAPEWSLATYWGNRPKEAYLETYARAARVILQLPEYAKFFPLLKRSNIRIIPNPIYPAPPEAQGMEKKNVIVCVARITLQQKHQDLLVEAFHLIAAEFPGWVIHLYGKEYGDEGSVLRALIRAKGLEDRVLFMGVTNDVYRVLGSASIFAFPSRFEGFPNALAEALASGLPSVGLRACPGVSTLLQDGHNGYLVEDNAEAFAAALKELMASPEKRKAMGERARQSTASYSPETISAMWESNIQWLIRQRKNPLSRCGPLVRLFFPFGKFVYQKTKNILSCIYLLICIKHNA